ncbi:DUF2336 domain-containing protein [Roseibium aggregatum]|uniref:DUF2336 domain-containing protein n=1 Tax=Roseibium aggregatum TaxID=187304 RepID=A0A926S4B7_9HYPH|nr:DUF2336 domain-containing protein [Roseibium aggregatum]MBD1545241.1 DUF2336 domain-containing protein [Roseibium aggregatum]
MLDALIELAKDSSTTKRRQLVDHVTELFAARAHKNRPEEIATFNELLEGVFDTLDEDDKQKISERLSNVKATSANLAFKLAQENLAIAKPFLERSKALQDAHLIQIASTQSQGHLLALSKREQLDASVSKKLVERGSKEVKKSLAANLGADMSLEDFEKVIKELPKQMGERIRHLRKSNEELIHDLFRDPEEIMAGEPLEKKEARIDVRQWIAGIRQGHVTLNKAISQLAFEKNLYDVTVLLSVASGLDHTHVINMMIRYDSTGIATLCRAIGIPDGEYALICKARCNHLKFPESTGSKWVTNYHVLDPTDAKRLLGLLKFKLQNRQAEAA